MKRYGRNILLVTLGIAVFLYFYIKQVNGDRASSIQQLFNQPQPGDIYKIRYLDNGGGTVVRYYRVAESNGESVFFYRGKLSAWNVSDVFLDQFDTDNSVSFSRQDLLDIKNGHFNNNEMRDAKLVEIERKAGFVPSNSL